MPVGRVLLKSISVSKKLPKLKTDGARLLYTWLLAHVDVNGCYEADPGVIKSHIFTRLRKSAKTVRQYLDDLERVGLIIRYEAKGDVYLIIPDFREKQPSLRPEREAKPTIPLPTPEQFQSKSGVNQELPRTSQVKSSKVKISQYKSGVTPVDKKSVDNCLTKLTDSFKKYDFKKEQKYNLVALLCSNMKSRFTCLGLDECKSILNQILKKISDKKPVNLYSYLKKSIENYFKDNAEKLSQKATGVYKKQEGD